jgi:hypothetical protein
VTAVFGTEVVAHASVIDNVVQDPSTVQMRR